MLSIQYYCPRWGAESVPWDTFTANVKAAGFDGVEVYPLQSLDEKEDMLHQLAEGGLAFSLIHSEMKEGADFGNYKLALERNLYILADYQTARIKPQFITSQTGRDYYTKDQMAECFSICDRISKECGITILQETHRNKWSFAAHVVKEYLRETPSLQLTLDLSHWVCVSESYLEDQQEAVRLAVQHTHHLHARVGHTQSPQVTDPRAPENREAVEHHLRWWDEWIKYLQDSGRTKCTITPEFGPSPYMPCKVGSTEPVASQWEINCYMKDFLSRRYAVSSSTQSHTHHP